MEAGELQAEGMGRKAEGEMEELSGLSAHHERRVCVTEKRVPGG